MLRNSFLALVTLLEVTIYAFPGILQLSHQLTRFVVVVVFCWFFSACLFVVFILTSSLLDKTFVAVVEKTSSP